MGNDSMNQHDSEERAPASKRDLTRKTEGANSTLRYLREVGISVVVGAVAALISGLSSSVKGVENWNLLDWSTIGTTVFIVGGAISAISGMYLLIQTVRRRHRELVRTRDTIQKAYRQALLNTRASTPFHWRF